MKKIISLFKRDYEGKRLVYNEIVEGAEWVIAGEGIATEKFDGTSCLIQAGVFYKRYDRKILGSVQKRMKSENYIATIDDFKPAPDGWIAAMETPDIHTGHYTGWLPVDYKLPENQYHSVGYAWLLRKEFPEGSVISSLLDGTYELVGSKVQGNPYRIISHELWKHGSIVLEDVPRYFEGIKEYLAANNIEGVVWHHPDGRMVKIKRSDFGLAWVI